MFGWFKKESKESKESKVEKPNSKGVNFYTVKEYIDSGKSLNEALVGAGFKLWEEYKLDYGNKRFMLIEPNNLDNVCINIKQNYMIDRYNPNNKVCMLVYSVDGQGRVGSISICLLVYIVGFGVVLLKSDKALDSYCNETGIRLYESTLNNRANMGYTKVALSKSFIKIAFNRAICINMLSGIEDSEDRQSISQISANEAKEIKNFLGVVGVRP